MKNYVVGYGSLINFESQNITGRSLRSIPAVLKNYTRSWSVLYDELNFCALGVYPERDANINVVVFETDHLEVFDRREHGYARHEVRADHLLPWSDQPIPTDGRIWIYLPFTEKFGAPSRKHSIWQSYVDVILMGCLSIEMRYAEEFIRSTTGWAKEHVNNDRETSTYIRALKTYDSDAIDQILKLIW